MSKARDIASAAPAPAGVTSTELGYVDGVTSAIQTQVDAKIAKTLTTTTGDIIYASGANTPARLGIGSSAQVLTVSGGVPAWTTPAGGGGKVLQVVQGTYATQTISSSTSYADTGITVTITPTSATSKVLILISTAAYIANSASASAINGGFQLVRASTNILTIGGAMQQNINANNGAMANAFNYHYLDSPATTSATVYKLQQKVDNSAGFILTSGGSTTSTIIALEIGA